MMKFAEFLEMGEYKRAQQLNNQNAKIWVNRKQYFTFNFALQCLVQGQVQKSATIFAQILVHEYQQRQQYGREE